jgi:ATP-dependent Lon protease
MTDKKEPEIDDRLNLEIPENLPTIPLRDLVVFPTMVFPLLIGRQSTLKAIDKATESDRLVFLVAQRDPAQEEPSGRDLFRVGVVGRIMQTLKLPNGLVKVLVEGIARAGVVKIHREGEGFQSQISVWEETDEMNTEIEGASRHSLEVFREYVQLNRHLPDEILFSASAIATSRRLPDFIMGYVNVEMETKQRILEIRTLFDRLVAISRLLEKEIEILKIEKSIDSQVREKISRSQRNFYLQEQMRIIKKELGEDIDEDFSDVILYRKKIRKANLPQPVKEKAVEELDKLKGMPMLSPEATVIKNYLDWITALPWVQKTEDNIDIKGADRILNEDHYGLEKPKERILEHLAVLQRVGNARGQIICFVGPPGVGKTSLGRSIARAMGRNFVRVSLGGIRDEAEIRGHRRTYIGSMPGRIIQSLKRAATVNPVFLLDEVDKMSIDFRGDPSSALLEVLDPEQNKHFSDHYLEVDYDLSQVIFITTANVRHNIPLPLQDRMEIIELPGYLTHEKIEIAQHFLIPKQLKEHGLEPGEIRFSRSSIQWMIEGYTREAGVRELERDIAKICRKVTRNRVEEPTNRATKITKSSLEKYLGIPRYRDLEIEEGDRVGMATGLAWTSTGGDILNIQVAMMKGKEQLTLTGQLGDVMKESARAALSYIRANAESLGVNPDFYKTKEIHIHIPEGAIPKDGPSAGVTLATAMLSALRNEPVPADIAMTGEITLRGNILPIGGLAEKLMAAKRAKIHHIIIPSRNEKDLKEIAPAVKNGLNIRLVGHIQEIWKELFVGLASSSDTPVSSKWVSHPHQPRPS